MTMEWFVAGLLLALALGALGLRLRSVAGWAVVLLAFGLALGAMALREGDLKQRAESRAALAGKTPRPIPNGGYVSSDQCRACHPDQYASWHHSFHRTMTQLPSAESVRGDFANVTLEHADASYHFERRGDEFWVDMVDPDWAYVQLLRRSAGQLAPAGSPQTPPRTRKRVSLVTGSHHMQAYWVPSQDGNMLFGLPFTYNLEAQRWLARNDVFLIDPEQPWTTQVWNVTCINCHATAGQPRQDARTKVIDSRAAELGIACEACHGPAENHLRANANPSRRYALHSAGVGDPTIFNPARKNHVKSAETCGQCHAIRHRNNKEQWNAEGLHFWPGEEIEAKAPLVKYDGADLQAPGNERKRHLMEGSFWSDGQVRVSGRDFSALAASACYTRGEISCLSCHSMHQYESTAHQLARGKEGNEACIQCHTTYAAKLEQHTRHRPGSPGSLCYNCHMPHTTYGLLKAIRSHTINSPEVRSSLATGRPNACNLCHLDRSLGWTAAQLHDWYGHQVPQLTEAQKTIPAGVSWLLQGDAGQRALIAWHMGWEPARRTSGSNWMPRFLAETLVDPYSTVRYISGRSLKRFAGFEGFSYDYIAPAAQRENARLRAIETSRGQTDVTKAPVQAPPGPGSLADEAIAALLRQRDNRRLELLE